GFPYSSSHQIDQVLERLALFSERPGLRRYAVPDPTAVIQKIRNPDPPGTLRRLQHAPQADIVYVTYIVLERFHIIHCSWVHTPVILIIFEIRCLTIDQSAKTHLTIERHKKLGERIYIFNSVVDVADRIEITGLAWRRRP